MKMLNFAKRNAKEILRDPLSIIFALLLPLFLLFIFQQFDIQGEAYRIENFTPGTLVFSFAFVSMFTATLVAKDRSSSLLVRLGVSPMRNMDYVGGYALAVLPLVLVQNLLFFALALVLGLPLTVGILYAALASLLLSLLFIAIGILLGSLTGEKSSAGASNIVVQLVAFTSGMYFDGELVGDFFSAVCRVLPFSGCVDVLKALLNGTGENLLLPCLTVALYTVVLAGLAILVFCKKRQNGNT